MALQIVVPIGLMILLPVAAAVMLRRRVAVPWWLFCVGVLTFAGSQAYHLPLNNWLADLGLIGPVAAADPNFTRTAVILGLSAGLSEAVARAIGYAVLFRFRKAQRWVDGVMVGLGHGGIEAMVIGGVFSAAGVSALLALQGTDLAALELTAAQQAAIETQMALMLGPSGLVLPLLERIIAMTLHVVLSLLVWQAFSWRNPLYFVAAVLYHALFDATAVYLSHTLTNFWLLEGVLALIGLPGVIWLWRGWPSEVTTATAAPSAYLAEWRLFAVALYKELLQQWRTKRMLVVTAVFVLFGLGSPLLAKFTPQMLTMIEEAQQFADLIPEPTTADSMTQYIKNITQFGFIIAVLLGMGAVAGEKERGTTAMILSKPMPRWAFLLSKFVAQALVYLLGFLLAGLGAYYYTSILFEPFLFVPFMWGNFLLLVWLLVFTAITLLGSTIANSTGAAAGLALVGAVMLLLMGSIPQVATLAPSGLVAWAGQLGLPDVAEVTANGGALAAAMVLIVLFLVTAVAVFETQEL